MTNIATGAAASDLRRDEITHRVLAICVTGTPTISRTRAGQQWNVHVNDLPVRNVFRLRTALTSLTKAGLICWSPLFMSAEVERAAATEAGKAMLPRWDADLLNDGDR